MKTHTRKPTIEDVLELSGIELLHPRGLEITERVGQKVDLRGKNVLDVACGKGTLACYYARSFGAKVVGIDLNPKMIRASALKAKQGGGRAADGVPGGGLTGFTLRRRDL